MDDIDKLVSMLAESGTTATRDQASALAVRVSGSVPAYIAELERTRAKLEDYQPEGEATDKLSAPLAYDVEPPQG